MKRGTDSSSSAAGGFEHEAASSPHADFGQQGALTTPLFATQERGELATPILSDQSGFGVPATASGTPISPSPSLPSPPSSRPPAFGQASQVKKRRSTSFILFIVLLLLVVVSAGSGAFFLLTHHSAAPVVPASNLVGQAFFVSSGQVSTDGSQGINDELEINLHNIPAPAPATSYYAWLLQDINQPAAVPLLLGKLPVKKGIVTFLYPGNAQHTNLLASTSRVLITVGNSDIPPINPLPDSSTWHYLAVIPQTPDPNDTLHHFSMLDHLRSLLADDPTLASLGLHGGLNTWLRRNTSKILEWSGSARDDWDSASVSLMRAQFIRILDSLDGQANVQVDVPAGTPLMVAAPVALIGTETSAPTDYLHQISGHLNGIALAPGVTSDTHEQVVRISSAMDVVRAELEHVRMDAKQLLGLSDTQLLTQASLLLLDDMETQAFYAYVGQVDPSSGQLQSGVVQISDEIERLATLDLSSYKP